MIVEPNCFKRSCLNFIGVKRREGTDEGTEFFSCKAFPDGIPDEISIGKNLHLKPFKGDNGIQYEKGEEVTLSP